MSQLISLKSSQSLHDVAHLLGFQPKSLAYILYKKPADQKYMQFDIPKRTGGTRTISAPYPDLKNLQKRLSDLLQNCIVEINEKRNIKYSLSHGFRRKHSIITNANTHRNKRYVFNIDLENFFGTINFGRVRGFFITNRNFELSPKVATILAQIACHENVLPQGSPCSPVVSNLIGHLLDIRLASLARKACCTYSRYADDLTFSSNKGVFPSSIAVLEEDSKHQWQIGKELKQTITKAGFKINATKTRMQYKDSRQDVTGLVVNAKVNTRIEYRRTARAMAHKLFTTGSYQRNNVSQGEDGIDIVTSVEGTLDQLNGVLSFINSIGVFNREKILSEAEKKKGLKQHEKFDSNEKTYHRFLFYKDFYASPSPVIVCEGKTDNIYIRSAIRRLADKFPQLAEKNKSGGIKLKIRLFQFTPTSMRLLGLSGGTGNLVNFLQTYANECKTFKAPGLLHPVIVLVDNDDGGKKVINAIKGDRKAPFLSVSENLYVVPTPIVTEDKGTTIEDCFEEDIKQTKIGGKKFNPSNTEAGSKNEYGKFVFAQKVIKPNEANINFNGFIPILERIVAVLNTHATNKN